MYLLIRNYHIAGIRDPNYLHSIMYLLIHEGGSEFYFNKIIYIP